MNFALEKGRFKKIIDLKQDNYFNKTHDLFKSSNKLAYFLDVFPHNLEKVSKSKDIVVNMNLKKDSLLNTQICK